MSSFLTEYLIYWLILFLVYENHGLILKKFGEKLMAIYAGG